MYKLNLLLVLAFIIVGCTHYQHSEAIDVDHLGATGSYQDHRSGYLHRFAFAAGGGGIGGEGRIGHAGWGMGGFGFAVESTQDQSDPTAFANAIAKINYSKKLKSVKYDEVTGVSSYEFADPVTGSSTKRTSSQTTYPSAFGYQPIE
ncbi:MAG: hypothetical protein BZ151_11285 [Desulfobacca sp. 4484_104]|nr:MAG: hypothetical protein BZ151_11285 [Desulfobacca sp. 4484_104]RLA88060.1 MAG: hypothetical protein DRG58_09115 [Deltaproteobacteria bacterium]